jgi:glycosyltransferase involved in cell wall biosynthesis
MKICIYTKILNKNLDEGITKIAYELGTKVLTKDHEVLVIFSVGDAIEKDNIVKIPFGSLPISRKIYAKIKKFHPEMIIYIPRASATLYTFFCARILKWYGNIKWIAMLVLQPNEFGPVSKRLATLIKPDLIFTVSSKTSCELASMGCQAKFIPLWVDAEKFKPVSLERKAELRYKYGLDPKSFIVLHTGHINNNRNIRLLKEIQNQEQQVLILGSTSTPRNKGLCWELQTNGIKLFTNYFNNIEELYQLSDCYVFPVVSGSASISIPLSVLEAMSCNLPIVTTKYGGLPDLFPVEANGLFYAEKGAQFTTKVRYLREQIGNTSIETRKMVQAYSLEKWGEEFGRTLESLNKRLGKP